MAHDHTTAEHHSLPPYQPRSGPKLSKDPSTSKNAQATVTCVYRAQIAGFWRNVTALWGKNLMNYTLIISLDGTNDDSVVHTCKIDLKPWHFWTKKGYKSFQVDGNPVDVYWDLRSAKFSGSSPEPSSNYYVALVSEDKVVLLIGDYKRKAYKRTKASLDIVNTMLFFKRENIFGKRSFATRAKFSERKREHDIVVEGSILGPKDPEMWITIDGTVLVHVKNLQWKFRGNTSVVIDKQPVHVLWDVYAWLYSNPGSSYGLFIFKSGEHDANGNGDEDTGQDNEDGDDRIWRRFNGPGMCLFLHAWKIE